MENTKINKILERAILIAVRAHVGQVDLGGDPLILHPLAVMDKVSSLRQKIIAVLHDVIEDTPITARTLIADGIPQNIVADVELLTRTKDKTYAEYIQDIKQSKDAVWVKIADLQHNLSWSRFQKLPKERHGLKKRYNKALIELSKGMAEESEK